MAVPTTPTEQRRLPEPPTITKRALSVGRAIGSPVGAVIFAFVLGAIVVAATGSDPFLAYGDLLCGGIGLFCPANVYPGFQISETLVYATPLILAGLAVAIAFKASLFNIGAEGQLILGAIATTVVGIKLANWPGWILLPRVLLAGTLAGAVWGGIVGVLKATVGGLLRPDSGEIFINGKHVQLHGPRDAIALGIGMVHQHFMLIPVLSVSENIVLGLEPVRPGDLYDQEAAARSIRELSERYGLDIDPYARTGDLPVGLQQRVEILKVLYRGADILILDEPTAVLTPQETNDLFKVLRGLLQQGKTIIFITHKLREVLEISDSITVLRRGRVVGHLITKETNEEEIARSMVGREVVLRVEKKPATPGPVALGVDDLTVKSERGLPAVRNLSFELHAGEILGIAGVEGNGQSELVEAVAGMRPAASGHIYLNGRDITALGARNVRDAGIAHIPEDRRSSGLILNYSIKDNTIFGRQRSGGFSWRSIVLRLAAILEWARQIIRDFDVRPPQPDVPVRTLSGGNQQKVIIGRELLSKPTVLLASQPTRGVDIGAIEFIHSQLVAHRDAGAVILLVSAELDEIRSLSDRIAVMYEGRIVSFEPANAPEERLGLLMAGGGRQQEHLSA